MVIWHKFELITSLVILLFFLIIIFSPITQAQNWVELPPYNTLWPLWSPVLSPVSDITGVPTPIVSSLTSDTDLIVMPGLTWDPTLPYPWLLYNTLSGLIYFDPLTGINSWPVPSLIDDTGHPAPIDLPTDYADLPSTDALWLTTYLPIANNSYILSYPSILPPFAGPTWLYPSLVPNLLSAQDILGPILGVPSALLPPLASPIAPPILTTPVPTVAVPTAAISALYIAEQAGTWSGNWISLIKAQSGSMDLDLVENPQTGLSGTAFLIGYNSIFEPFEVAGPLPTGGFFILRGTYVNPTSGATYDIEFECTLISDTRIEGNYFIEKVGATKADYGEISLNLVTPVITVPAPTVTPVVPAPAPVVPAPTVPVAPTPIVPPGTIPVPVTSTVPIAPVVTTPVPVPPTAAVSGLFWWWF